MSTFWRHFLSERYLSKSDFPRSHFNDDHLYIANTHSLHTLWGVPVIVYMHGLVHTSSVLLLHALPSLVIYLLTGDV